ncbi:MAG: hypothetical protein Q7U98_09045 [Methylicorpusculum sp.]|nr:hypothetical protein [Methylicorpusculum sp.]MDO8939295.1 hypothetical protein [Methylicorpusculum sp.]MDP2201655.1 hypothetical protein [Methylicorpusculum sp.]
MQSPHAFSSTDINRVLFLERGSLIPGDEAEQPDVFVKLFQGEVVLLVFLKVIESEPLEVGNQNISGRISILEAGKIVLCLVNKSLPRDLCSTSKIPFHSKSM